MANFIPIASSPDGAGGYLIQEEYGSVLVDAIARTSAVAVLANFERTSSRRRTYPRLIGRPTAAFVAASADIPASGAEFANLVVNVKKIATILLYEEEELEDAATDPQNLLGPEVEAAFADLIDAHVLGLAAGAAITTGFDQSLHAGVPAGGEVELGATADALAVAVSAGMAYVEGNGGRPNGLATALDLNQHVRDARDANGRPLYQGGMDAIAANAGQPASTFWGLRWATTTNLDAFPAGAGKVAAIGGDWTKTKGIIRRDVTVRVSTDATVNVAGTDHRTFQQEKVAVKYTIRVGFNAHQIDKMFFEVLNAV